MYFVLSPTPLFSQLKEIIPLCLLQSLKNFTKLQTLGIMVYSISCLYCVCLRFWCFRVTFPVISYITLKSETLQADVFFPKDTSGIRCGIHDAQQLLKDIYEFKLFHIQIFQQNFLYFLLRGPHVCLPLVPLWISLCSASSMLFSACLCPFLMENIVRLFQAKLNS